MALNLIEWLRLELIKRLMLELVVFKEHPFTLLRSGYLKRTGYMSQGHQMVSYEVVL